MYICPTELVELKDNIKLNQISFEDNPKHNQCDDAKIFCIWLPLPNVFLLLKFSFQSFYIYYRIMIKEF